jgi:hypothetical protein
MIETISLSPQFSIVFHLARLKVFDKELFIRVIKLTFNHPLSNHCENGSADFSQNSTDKSSSGWTSI